MNTKKNCWEFKNCGREVDGSKSSECGVCPANIDKSFDGINEGFNAGRVCWLVAGTLCRGEKQGTFAEKRASCISCDFFSFVKKQEGIQFCIKAPIAV